MVVDVVRGGGAYVPVGGKRVTVGTVVEAGVALEPEQPASINRVVRMNALDFHNIEGLSILQQTHEPPPSRFYNKVQRK
jgi:hypothetical protein